MQNEELAAEGVFLGGGQWHNNYQLMTLIPESMSLTDNYYAIDHRQGILLRLPIPHFAYQRER